MTHQESIKPVLILGGNGKTGRRVAAGLREKGRDVVLASRSADPRFDWNDRSTWPAVLEGVGAVYITYQPDLAVAGAVDDVRVFAEMALQAGVRRLVLLSGRGEEEAQRAEAVLQSSGADWTIVRAGWFSQNFSENFLIEGILGGQVVLPETKAKEPFVDADDIAEVVVEALLDDKHIGALYEVTGPRLISFAEAVQEIGKANCRTIDYLEVPPAAYEAAMREQQLPEDLVSLIMYLFTTVLDGRNEYLTDGIQEALGRAPRDFSDYVRGAHEAGAWAA